MGPGPQRPAGVEVACEAEDMEIPDALRIAISNPIGASWQLDLTSAAIAADPDAWTDQPVDDPEPVIGPMLAIGSLVGPVLRYRAWDDSGLADVAVYRPDDEVWARFDEALRRLGVWEWRAPTAIGDPAGGAWAVGIVWRGRTIDIEGVGSWPPAGQSAPGPEWARFMRAVHRLAGGRGFDVREHAHA